MDETVRVALLGVALPGVIALAGGLLAAWPPRRRTAWVEGVLDDALRPGALRAGIVAPFAFAVAMVVCVRMVADAAIFPPGESLHRLAIGAIFIAGTALMGGLVLPTLGPRTSSGWALAAAMGAAMAIAVVAGPQLWNGTMGRVAQAAAALPESARPGFIGTSGLLVLAATGAWAAATAWGTAALAQRGLRVGASVVLIGTLVGVAVACAANGSFRFGWLGAGGATIAAGLVGLSLVHPRAGVPAAGIACACALGGTLVIYAALFIPSFPLWLIPALALPPLAASGADAVMSRRAASGRARTAGAIAAAAVVALAAIAPGTASLLNWKGRTDGSLTAE